MKKSELKRQVDELRSELERLNGRVSRLEGREQDYIPHVYRSANPLCPEQNGWKITCSELPGPKYQTGLPTRPADTGPENNGLSLIV